MLTSITNYLSSGVERSLMTIGGLVGAAFSFAFGDVAILMLWLITTIYTIAVFSEKCKKLYHKDWHFVSFYGTVWRCLMVRESDLNS